MEIKIKYFTDINKLTKIEKGDWIDLRCSKDMLIKKGEYALIPLGVGMILPDRYEAHIAPRSSTFKNFGLLQTNSMGIIDNSYSGENDEYKMPVLASRDIQLYKGDRVCQFRIVEKQPEIEFIEIEKLNDVSRGGFGSTGIK